MQRFLAAPPLCNYAVDIIFCTIFSHKNSDVCWVSVSSTGPCFSFPDSMTCAYAPGRDALTSLDGGQNYCNKGASFPGDFFNY